MGKILHVDLTSRQFVLSQLDLDEARAYIGGLGMNAWLMQKTYETGTDPLSPDNPIIFGAGPLVATGVPGAAKIIATTRFPLNSTISESVGSMRFARRETRSATPSSRSIRSMILLILFSSAVSPR